MSNTKQYLDYAGLQTYHNELIQRLVDLEFEPNKMFADVNALVTRSNWVKNNRIAGTGKGAKGTAQAKAACICGGDAEAGHGVGTHTGLNDGVLDADKLGKSGFKHCSFLRKRFLF